MKKVIWKDTLSVTDEQTIDLPDGYQFLSLQLQQGKPCLWALVDESQAIFEVKIRIFGTGHPIPAVYPNLEFIGTFSDGRICRPRFYFKTF